MKHYLVSIATDMPYPVTKEYREITSSFPTAIARAVKAFRKDIGRKKITELRVKAVFIGNNL